MTSAKAWVEKTGGVWDETNSVAHGVEIVPRNCPPPPGGFVMTINVGNHMSGIMPSKDLVYRVFIECWEDLKRKRAQHYVAIFYSSYSVGGQTNTELGGPL